MGNAGNNVIGELITRAANQRVVLPVCSNAPKWSGATREQRASRPRNSNSGSSVAALTCTGLNCRVAVGGEGVMNAWGAGLVHEVRAVLDIFDVSRKVYMQLHRALVGGAAGTGATDPRAVLHDFAAASFGDGAASPVADLLLSLGSQDTGAGYRRPVKSRSMVQDVSPSPGRPALPPSCGGPSP
eukprot:gene10781-biopygen13883